MIRHNHRKNFFIYICTGDNVIDDDINIDDEFNYNEVKNYFFTKNANKPLNNDNEKPIFKFIII